MTLLWLSRLFNKMFLPLLPAKTTILYLVKPCLNSPTITTFREVLSLRMGGQWPKPALPMSQQARREQMDRPGLKRQFYKKEKD